jgi:hypothetical protein
MVANHSGFKLLGNIDGNSNAKKCENMANPTNAQDYVTKNYVDTYAGLLASANVWTNTNEWRKTGTTAFKFGDDSANATLTIDTTNKKVTLGGTTHQIGTDVDEDTIVVGDSTITINGTTISTGAVYNRNGFYVGASDDYHIYLSGSNLQIDGTGGVISTQASLALGGDLALSSSAAKNIILSTTYGTKIGTGTSELLGFFNATPVTQQTATFDLGVVLSNLGLRASGQNYSISTSGSLQATGTVAFGYVAKTSTYSIATTDFLINCTSGTFTTTLHTAVNWAGRIICVKNSGTGTITVATTSSQTIDGSTTKLLYANEELILMSDGANWIILSFVRNFPYGSCYGNEINWTQASAVQNTAYLVSDADMSDGALNLFTHDGSGKLTATKAGVYEIKCYGDLEVSAANKHVVVGVAIDGTAQTTFQVHIENAAANQEETWSFSGLFTLTAGQTIEAYVKCTDAGTPNLLINHLGITATLVST